MTWALKRQIFYIFILILFFGTFGFLIISPALDKAPTCQDGFQNGDETGVDCGGSCALVCSAEVDDISVLWSRAFKVVDGRYNAVAYLENQNDAAVVKKINYRFRFADKDNLYIGQREGSAFVPAGGKFAVFEPGVNVGNSIPVYTTFEFTEVPVWLAVEKELLNTIKVFPSNIVLENETTNPTLSVNIKNNSFYIVPQVNVTAILYDANGNALSASRSIVDELGPEEEKGVFFTWPEPWEGAVVTKEIIPTFDIFLVKIK